MPVGPFAWVAKIWGGSTVVKVCATGCVVAAAAGGAYEVWQGQRVTRGPAPSPVRVLGGKAATGQTVRVGGAIPAGFAVVRRQVRLPVETRPVTRSVVVICPAGMLVVSATDPPTLDKTSRFQPATPLPYRRSPRMRILYRPKPNLPVPGRLTVGILCQDADALARQTRDRVAQAIAALPAAVRPAARRAPARVVCADDTQVFTRGGIPLGALLKDDRIRVMPARTPRRGWTRGFAEGDILRIGWVHTRDLC